MMLLRTTTLRDHVSGLPGEIVTNTQCWVALEANHSSMAAFSNLKAEGDEAHIDCSWM